MRPRAIRGPRTAAFIVGDNFYRDANASAPDDNSVTIDPGETVTFTSPAMARERSVHNVVFDDGAQPTTCTQTEAPEGTEIDTDDQPPIPNHSPGAGLGGRVQVQLARHLHVLLPGPRRRDDGHRHRHRDARRRRRRRDRDAPRPPPRRRHADRPDPHAPTTAAPTYWWQDASSSSTTDNSVTIKAGDRVTFDYPSGHERAQRHVPDRPSRRRRADQGRGGPDTDDGRPPLPDNLSSPGLGGVLHVRRGRDVLVRVPALHPAMTGTVVVEPVATPRRPRPDDDHRRPGRA